VIRPQWHLPFTFIIASGDGPYRPDEHTGKHDVDVAVGLVPGTAEEP
jgi:hypothetical protein